MAREREYQQSIYDDFVLDEQQEVSFGGFEPCPETEQATAGPNGAMSRPSPPLQPLQMAPLPRALYPSSSRRSAFTNSGTDTSTSSSSSNNLLFDFTSPQQQQRHPLSGQDVSRTFAAPETVSPAAITGFADPWQDSSSMTAAVGGGFAPQPYSDSLWGQIDDLDNYDEGGGGGGGEAYAEYDDDLRASIGSPTSPDPSPWSDAVSMPQPSRKKAKKASKTAGRSTRSTRSTRAVETGSNLGIQTSSMARDSGSRVSPGLGSSPTSATSPTANTASSHPASGASKLRSASRTSKNALHRPAETPEERRSRASHNLVEKQYRNRLNAQFETLLNSLPDDLRRVMGVLDPAVVTTTTTATTAATATESSSLSPGPAGHDPGERRVSKAEVLDMARRHIKSLEREREDLEKERVDLLDNMDKFKRALMEEGDLSVPSRSPRRL